VRAALGVMALLLGALLLAVGRQGLWAELFGAARRQALGLLPLLALAVLLAAAVEVLLPAGAVQAWLGREAGFRGVLLAWVGGILTPGGGPIGLPLVATLARQGASLPVLLTYLLSMSLLSLLRVPLEAALLGGRLTALRLGASLLLPPLVGGAALLLARLGR
jgi:uncharacterized membrane protein YraQ (UPF0718 family)